MFNCKRFLGVLMAVIMVIGIIPITAYADPAFDTYTFTVPTAQAEGDDEPLIVVGMSSDPHTDYGLQNSDPYIRETYITAMNALKEAGSDVILIGGDITSDNEENSADFRWERSVYDTVVSQYEKYGTAASTTGKILWAAGNHDYEVGRLKEGVDSEGDYDAYEGFQDMMLEHCGTPVDLFTQSEDSDWASKTIYGDHWLGAHYVINDFDFVIVNSPYAKSTYYSTDTINWLDETLEKIGEEKTVFVMGHYPLDQTHGLEDDADTLSGTNNTQFMNVMSKYDNAIYLYGHVHGTERAYIAADVFEKITHYDENGMPVESRLATPKSFITAIMGSMAFYKYSLNPGWLTAETPYIIQAMTISVYKDRIEFKMINCGEKEGELREPLTWTVKRDVLGNGDVVVGEGNVSLWTLPTDIISTDCVGGPFSLHYMDQKTGTLYNDWVVADGKTYVNVSGGFNKGTFALRENGGIMVFPEYGKSAVIKFTAPESGVYEYEAPVAAIGLTANGTGNKQIVFSVMKDGVIHNITQPVNNVNYGGILKGKIELEEGESLLFLADQYVKYFSAAFSSADHNGGWRAGYFMDLNLRLVAGPSGDTSIYDSYSYDGTGLNFTEAGYSIKANDHFTIVGIDYANKTLLDLSWGNTAVYNNTVGAALYKGAQGNVTIAYRNAANTAYMYGPYGAGNTNKNIAAGVAFTAPEDGIYNLTSLLYHDWDYNSGNKYNVAVIYEILDSDMNVVFSGNTANTYTAANVQDTYSRAAGTVRLNKGESAYLIFRAAPEATYLTADTIAMKILTLNATQIPCEHDWNGDDTCDLCGVKCAHTVNSSEATCAFKAICAYCEQFHGNLDPDNHEDEEENWIITDNTHALDRTCCDAYDVAEEAHEYGDDHICDECGYVGVEYDNKVPDKVEIPANDKFESGTIVKIKEITAGTVLETIQAALEDIAEKFLPLEFTAEKDGVPVQPDGKLTVNITIPDGFSTNVTVHYLEDNGTLTPLATTVSGRVATVELEHFSSYVLVDNESAPETSVETVDTITGIGDSADTNVTGKFDSYDRPDVYKVDVIWGAMEFNYYEGDQVWNTTTHKWEAAENGTPAGWQIASGSSNEIRIENHSSCSVNATFSFTEADAYLDVIGGAFTYDGSALDAALELEAPTADQAAKTYTVTFMPTGELDSNATTSVTIGTITVTLS